MHADEGGGAGGVQHEGGTPQVEDVGDPGGDDGVADAGDGVVAHVTGAGPEQHAVVRVGGAWGWHSVQGLTVIVTSLLEGRAQCAGVNNHCHFTVGGHSVQG